jgi:hypothetical protein
MSDTPGRAIHNEGTSNCLIGNLLAKPAFVVRISVKIN